MAARGHDIDLVAVGIGSNVNRSELRAIASDPVDRNVHVASNFNDGFDSLLDGVHDSICNRELSSVLTFTLPQTCSLQLLFEENKLQLVSVIGSSEYFYCHFTLL